MACQLLWFNEFWFKQIRSTYSKIWDHRRSKLSWERWVRFTAVPADCWASFCAWFRTSWTRDAISNWSTRTWPCLWSCIATCCGNAQPVVTPPTRVWPIGRRRRPPLTCCCGKSARNRAGAGANWIHSAPKTSVWWTMWNRRWFCDLEPILCWFE